MLCMSFPREITTQTPGKNDATVPSECGLSQPAQRARNWQLESQMPCRMQMKHSFPAMASLLNQLRNLSKCGCHCCQPPRLPTDPSCSCIRVLWETNIQPCFPPRESLSVVRAPFIRKGASIKSFVLPELTIGSRSIRNFEHVTI